MKLYKVVSHSVIKKREIANMLIKVNLTDELKWRLLHAILRGINRIKKKKNILAIKY